MSITDPVQQSVWIDITLIDFRPDARFHGDDEIAQLSQSMQKKQLQNIIVTPTHPSPLEGEDKGGARFEVIAGVGRVMAARKLGWEKIRADVYEGLSGFDKLSVTFSENEERKDAPPLYQAKVLQEMMQAEHLNQQQLADSIGKDESTVSKYMALFKLSPKIREELNRFNSLGVAHFDQLLRIENEDTQWKVAISAVGKDLSVKELQAVVDKELGVKSGAKKMGRPKGAQSLGDRGFVITQKKGSLAIRAVFPLNSDLDGFLARLREEIRSRQPQPAVSAVEAPSPTETSVN